MLDTSVLIDIEKKDKTTINRLKELSELHPSPAVITFMSYFEFIYGLEERNPKKKLKAKSFINNFGFLKPDKETAKTLSELKRKYDKKRESTSFSKSSNCCTNNPK